LAHGVSFNALLVPVTLEDSLNEDAGQVNGVRIKFTDLDQFFHFGTASLLHWLTL
jgi:hypothetical protein